MEAISTKESSIVNNLKKGNASSEGDQHHVHCSMHNPRFWKRVTITRVFCLMMASAVLLVAIGLMSVFIGAKLERLRVTAAPSTDGLYNSSAVCGIVTAPLLGQTSSATYDNAADAHAHEASIIHCGECGQCSNVHDIEIVKQHAETLTGEATSCAKRGLVQGLNREIISQCLRGKVGFTEPCQDCWVDNVMCSVNNCKFSCLMSRLWHEGKNINRRLNGCLECDEKLCGPAFLQCAGANRRRVGVTSDIERDPAQLCDVVDG